MIRTLLSLFLLLALTPPLAWAGIEDDLSATQKTDNLKALRELRASAAAGDADAQFNLGGVFFKGQAVEQDYAESAKWLRLAAVQGHALAQYNMGMMYDSGQGVMQDHTEAARWYRLAADQGFALAQLNLGVAYTNGEGVPQNEALAVKLFRLAAEQGEAQAQFDLGVMYANGQGIKQDLVEAYRWARLAATQEHEMAKTLLGDLAKKMTPAQQARGNKLALLVKTAAPASDTNEHGAGDKSSHARISDQKPASRVKPIEEASSGSDDYYVQLGAFKSQKQAADFMEKMHDKLGDIDKPYLLFSNEGWIRIHLGPYHDQLEARRSADNLKDKLGFAPKIRQH